MSLLSISALDAGYGELQVLDGVDLDVADGEHVTIVGPNGAGKSTVLKAVFGFATYMGGSITYKGDDITNLAPEEIVEKGVGYVPQTDNVFPSLTVRENLEIGAYLKDEVADEQYAEVYERFPILEERGEQRAGTLSGGQRQMLAMGQTLMLDPDLLLVDEPSAGLAPDLVIDTLDKIDEINAEGTGVLMVEQNAKEALRRCDRGYVLAQGTNFFEGPGTDLLENEDVRQRFLGG
jgi:branched-chain amino acid transport system ATP-binding protein